MKSTTKETISTGAILVLFFGLPIFFMLYPFGVVAWEHFNPKTVCTTSSIPYQTTEVIDETLYKGDHVGRQEGVTGELTTCKKKDTIVNEYVSKDPVTKITATGTKDRWAEWLKAHPIHYETGGAICADGTRSYSTGRGTCSWHGGVSYWLD